MSNEKISVRRQLLERLRGCTPPWDLLKYFRGVNLVDPEVKSLVERCRAIHATMKNLTDTSELLPGTESSGCLDLVDTLNDHIYFTVVPQLEKLLRDGKEVPER